MATYLEIRGLFNDGDLSNKVDFATVIAAKNLLVGTPSLSEQKWAAGVFANPSTEGQKALMAVLAANNGSSVAQIQGASDAAIQINVDSVVDSLVIAYAG